MLQRLSLTNTLHDLIHPGANHSQMFDESPCVSASAGWFRSPEASIFNQSRIPDVALIELEVRARENYTSRVSSDRATAEIVT